MSISRRVAFALFHPLRQSVFSNHTSSLNLFSELGMLFMTIIWKLFSCSFLGEGSGSCFSSQISALQNLFKSLPLPKSTYSQADIGWSMYLEPRLLLQHPWGVGKLHRGTSKLGHESSLSKDHQHNGGGRGRGLRTHITGLQDVFSSLLQARGTCLRGPNGQPVSPS